MVGARRACREHRGEDQRNDGEWFLVHAHTKSKLEAIADRTNLSRNYVLGPARCRPQVHTGAPPFTRGPAPDDRRRRGDA